MTRSGLIDLIVRAAAALETPSDLSDRERVDVIEDHRAAEDELKETAEREKRHEGTIRPLLRTT